jgi:hypothetical protein
MWTTFALVAAVGLAPGQSGSLAITHVRTTYGVLGAPRPDNKFLPGDEFTLSFDIEGIKVDSAGKLFYSIGMEVTDRDGKVQFKQEPRDQEATNSLGGTSLPACANLQIGLEHAPGTFTLKVTVTDLVAKTSQSVTSTYEVLPKEFGLVRPAITADPEGRFPVPCVGQGQSLWVNFASVGFGRDKGKGQPNLSVTMSVLKENGDPVVDKPAKGEVVNQDVPAKALALPMQFTLAPNRAGKFTVVLKAMDNVNGKSATLSLPLTVMAPPGSGKQPAGTDR